MTAPRRRWFRFSLRTLFVVMTALGVALGWLAWQRRIIRERHSVFDMIETRTGVSTQRNPRDELPYLGWARRSLGDVPQIWKILLPAGKFTAKEQQRIAAAFDEAPILIIGAHSNYTGILGGQSIFVIGEHLAHGDWPSPESIRDQEQPQFGPDDLRNDAHNLHNLSK